MEQYREQLRNLDLQQLREYVEATGWQMTHERAGVRCVYRKPEGRPREIVIPLDREFDDYESSLATVIVKLSEAEDRQPAEVIRSIQHPRSDIVKIHIEGPDTEDGAIAFMQGIAVFDAASRALLATACDVEQQRRYHAKIQQRRSVEFLEACRLGTEPGSFVAEIICPLDYKPEEDEVPPTATIGPDGQHVISDLTRRLNESFGRKVTRRLVQRVADAIQDIGRGEEAEKYTNANVLNPPMSGNVFGAISELKPLGSNTKVSLSVDWAPIAPEPNDIPREVEMNRTDFESFHRIAEALKPTMSPETSHFTGTVMKLEGKHDDADRPFGQVTVYVLNARSRTRNALTAWLNLDADDHATALKAYYRNRPIAFQGVLRKNPRGTSTIDNVQNFTLIGDEPSAASLTFE